MDNLNFVSNFLMDYSKQNPEVVFEVSYYKSDKGIRLYIDDRLNFYKEKAIESFSVESLGVLTVLSTSINNARIIAGLIKNCINDRLFSVEYVVDRIKALDLDYIQVTNDNNEIVYYCPKSNIIDKKVKTLKYTSNGKSITIICLKKDSFKIENIISSKKVAIVDMPRDTVNTIILVSSIIAFVMIAKVWLSLTSIFKIYLAIGLLSTLIMLITLSTE